MKISLKVEGFFNLTSLGPTVVFKFANLDTIISHGMIINNIGHSKWKIRAISTPKIKYAEGPGDEHFFTVGYHLEHIDGDNVLNEGDIVYIESEKSE